MAKQSKINKTELIREYMAQHPEDGPSAVAKALEKYKISAAYVSNIKMKLKGGGILGRGVPNGSAEAVVAAAEFIKMCGGVDQAKAAIRAAEKVVAALDRSSMGHET